MKTAADLEIPSFKNMRLWFLLAFQSGAVNAGGFVACGRFVTHTTGFATHFGLELALKKWNDAIGILTVPIFFLLGAMFTSYFVDLRIRSSQRPNYKIPAVLIFIALITAMILGELGWFGLFGEELVIAKDYLLMVLLCFASGLQNALIVGPNGKTIRTTHLTGITTDLASGIVRMLFSHASLAANSLERQQNLARVGMIGSFVIGSALATVLFLKFSYLGFTLPVATSLYFLFELYSLRRDAA